MADCDGSSYSATNKSATLEKCTQIYKIAYDSFQKSRRHYVSYFFHYLLSHGECSQRSSQKQFLLFSLYIFAIFDTLVLRIKREARLPNKVFFFRLSDEQERDIDSLDRIIIISQISFPKHFDRTLCKNKSGHLLIWETCKWPYT